VVARSARRDPPAIDDDVASARHDQEQVVRVRRLLDEPDAFGNGFEAASLSRFGDEGVDVTQDTLRTKRFEQAAAALLTFKSFHHLLLYIVASNLCKNALASFRKSVSQPWLVQYRRRIEHTEFVRALAPSGRSVCNRYTMP
jgi:hypothetical protein